MEEQFLDQGIVAQSTVIFILLHAQQNL